MSNTTNEFLPVEARKRLYPIYGCLGVILGATQVGFAAAEAGQPTWLTVALAVYTFTGGALFGVAKANTPTEG